MGRYEIIESRHNVDLKNNCPLLIERMALINDRLDNTVLAQISFKNLSDLPIISLQIKMECFDGTTWHSKEYIYSGFKSEPGTSFGFDQQIILPAGTEKIEIICIKTRN